MARIRLRDLPAPPSSEPAPASGVVKAARPRKPKGQVVEDLALWNQATRIGGGLTPAKISSIIREADSGDCRRLLDLENECRQRDAHLHACLSVNEETVAGLPFQVVPAAGNDAKAKDKRAAQWVDKVLRDLPGMQRLIADMAGAIYYGFSVSEIIWKTEEGKIVPDRFRHIAQRRFRFRMEDGKLVFQDMGEPEIDFQDKYRNKFIVSQPRVNGDAPHREGLGRPLVWMSAMRNWALADWLKTGELSWKPWRIGTYKKSTASTTDREDLEAVMRKLTTDHSAVVNDGMEIDIQWPGGNQSSRSTHAEIVNTFAQEISKAVLGQTETTQASSSSGYAQAKVHDAVRKDLREARARIIAADITRDLIAPMVAMNFGPRVLVPRFQFVTQDPVDLKEFAEAIKTLKDAGGRLPEVWVHEQGGIPLPKKDERLFGIDPDAPKLGPDGQPIDPNDPNAPKKPDAAKPAPANEKPETEPNDGSDEEEPETEEDDEAAAAE